jgi:tetratricopeptide (TPR) repeat protein
LRIIRDVSGIVLAAILAGGCAATTASHQSSRSASFGATIESGDPRLASGLLRLAVDRSADSLVNIAIRYSELGISDKAMDYYSEALSVDPRNLVGLDGRARVWRDWGFTAEALSDVDRGLKVAPYSAAFHNTRGTILQTLHRYAEAADEYTAAARLAPTSPYAINNRGYLAFIEGRTEEALRDCSEALRRSPSFVPARHNLALIHAALGNNDLANSYFGRSSDAIARYNMGIVFLARKDYTRAAIEFDAATRTNPSFARAHRRAHQARHLAYIETERLDGYR